MTLKMYASRKGWDLKDLRCVVTHSKVHAEDCAECETKEGKVDRLVRTLSFGGDFTSEERQKLLEIADKCPVHRTLHSEIEILTEVAEG